MYIQKIELKNFRNFEHLEMEDEFHPGVNLLVGVNGSGKTSLLEALSFSVSGFLPRKHYETQQLSPLDLTIKNGLREGQMHIKAQIDQGVSVNISMAREGKLAAIDSTIDGAAPHLVDILKKDINSLGDKTTLPLLCCFSTNRIFSVPLGKDGEAFDPTDGRKNGYWRAFLRESFVSHLQHWWGNAALRRFEMAAKNIQKPDQVLTNVEQAVERAVAYFYFAGQQKKSKVSVYKDLDFPDDLFLALEEGGAHLPLSCLPDGLRNLIFLVLELVWRASQLNPDLTLEEITERVDGIVMIDEIDLHLHPRWQAKAVPFLQEMFPKVQFFITTHSPTVVGNFSGGHLFTISDNEVKRVREKYFGKEVNEVLTEILGAKDRNAEVGIMLDQLRNLADTSPANGAYKALFEKLVGVLGKYDNDLQRIQSAAEWNALSTEERGLS